MKSPTRKFLATIPLLSLCAGCATGPKPPDLGRLYGRSAQYHGIDRNPIIVIPGVMGSRLEESRTGRPVWGAFSGEYLDPRDPAGARLAALPMRPGEPLESLRDDVISTAALDRLEFRLFGLPIELQAYSNILGILGAGGYRDEDLGMAGAIDYGTDHFTCFQFHYDWRRSNVENARALLPDIPDAAARRTVALDHLEKCLVNAQRLHAALDLPADPPATLGLHLVAADSEPTYHQLRADKGSLEVAVSGPGDGTVARYSALMDERQGRSWQPYLDSPIAWDHVTFLFNNHLGMTMDPIFMDNILYLLLEAPRR